MSELGWGVVIIVLFVFVVKVLASLDRPAPGAKQSARTTGDRDPGFAYKRQFTGQLHGMFFDNDDGSSRQDAIRECSEGEELTLVPEPDNRHDPDAVKICRLNGAQLGYWRGGDSHFAEDVQHFRVFVDEIYATEEDADKLCMKIRIYAV